MYKKNVLKNQAVYYPGYYRDVRYGQQSVLPQGRVPH